MVEPASAGLFNESIGLIEELQSRLKRSSCVMFALVPDGVEDPIEVTLAEAHLTISSLPLENLAPGLLVDLMCRRPFQLLYEFADGDERFDADCQMHMIVRSSQPMQVCASNATEFIPQDLARQAFDLPAQQRAILLRVPIQMDVEFVVHMAAHVILPVEAG